MPDSVTSLDHTVDQHLAAHPPSEHPAASSTAADSTAGVAANWWHGLQSSVQGIVHPPPTPAPATPPTPAQQAQHAVATARQVQSAVGAVMGALSVPGDMLNTGFANLTAPLAKIVPSFPAATITMLYVGMPHTHTHPPSLIPPAPPVPLPSLGSVMLGTSVKVLINGMPAARCGDIGLAPTCCGFTPFFQIKTGSSNVFIGGTRAARMTDICQACATREAPPTAIAAGKVMGAIGSAARAIQKVQHAMGYAAMAMDVAEAVADDGAMRIAKATAAATDAAQLAADKAAQALGQAMGKDPAGIPPRVLGAIVLGHPNVMIGGFPMVNIPNPAEMLLKRLARYKRAPSGGNKGNEGPCGTEAQPINLITGAFFDRFVDFELDGPIPLVWARHYDSRWTGDDGAFGPGFRHQYQYTLCYTLDGVMLVTSSHEAIVFPLPDSDGDAVAQDGFLLRWLREPGRYAVERTGRPTMVFHFGPDATTAPLAALRVGRHWAEFAYDADGHLAAVHDSSGQSVSMRYHQHGRMSQITRWSPGAEAPVLVAAYDYDALGLLTAWTDAFGHRSGYRYDAHRRMVGRTDRRGYSFYNEYDAEGRCTREYGEDGLWDARVEYVPAERRSVATYADGATTTVYYDEHGLLTDVVEPSGGRTRFVFDDAGRILEEVDPLGNVTPWVYDARGGNVGRLTPQGHLLPPLDVEPNPPDPLAYVLPRSPLEWECGGLLAPRAAPPLLGPNGVAPGPHQAGTRLTRDVLGRVVEELDDDGHTRRWWYDPEGNVSEYQDADGAVYRYTYGSWNLLHECIDPTGAVTTYEHSIRAEVARITDPNGSATEYVRDAWDRVVEVWRHGALKDRYRYDLADNLIEKRDGAGRPLLDIEVLPGNLNGVRALAAGAAHRFVYDDAGRITGAATDELEVEFAYDRAGRMLKDHRDGTGVEHEFVGGALAATRYLDRFRVAYARSADGALAVIDPTGAVHRWRVDESGSVVRELANGTVEEVRYDAAGRCLRKTGSSGRHGRTPRWNDRYTYSPEGDLLAVEQLRGITHYAYDAAHRLRREMLPTGGRRGYVHDAAENLLVQPGLGGVALLEGNRLSATDAETFAYDDRNRMARRQGRERTVSYEYDALDMLVACDIDGERWIAGYDPLCRRVRKTWRGQTTTYFWDDFRLAAEERHDGHLRLYVYVDERALVPFLCVEYDDRWADPKSGRCYHVFTNQIGAVVRVEDARSVAVWRAQLDPYGTAHVSAGSTFDMPLRFPGHYYDEETGLHCNRFRYYDPVLGRFVQSDPSGVGGGLNVYAYSSNPLVEVDLDGLAVHNPKKRRKAKTTEAGKEQEDDASSGNGGAAEGSGQPKMDKVQQRAAREAARIRAEIDARNAGKSEKNREPYPICTAVVRDKKTGKVYVATSGQPILEQSKAHPDLGMPTNLKSKETWPPGNCAEPKAMNEALNDGSKKQDLQVASVNTADGSPKQCCRNCTQTTKGTTVSPTTSN